MTTKNPYDLSSGDRVSELRASNDWFVAALNRIAARAKHIDPWKRDNIKMWEKQARGKSI